MRTPNMDKAPPEQGERARCALCGYQPDPDNAAQLRELGVAPVSIVVCADPDACVDRYFGREEPSTPRS